MRFRSHLVALQAEISNSNRRSLLIRTSNVARLTMSVTRTENNGILKMNAVCFAFILDGRASISVQMLQVKQCV